MKVFLNDVPAQYDAALDAGAKRVQELTEMQKNGSINTEARTRESRKAYWRPNLSDQEWSLLNRTIANEIETSDKYLDEETKWFYRDEKGVRVFAVYGIGDGTEPTPLYASGGKQTALDNEMLQNRMEGKENGNIKNRSTLGRLLGDIKRERTGKDAGLLGNGRGRRQNAGFMPVSGRQSGSERSGDTGGGTKNRYSLKDSVICNRTARERRFRQKSG